MWWIAGGVFTLLVVDVLVRAFVIRLILPLFERQQPFRVPAANVDPQAVSLRFSTDDGLELAGAFWEPSANGHSRGIVVFCPEMTGTRWSALRYCAGLRAAGFSVFSFDFRNQGESESQAGYRPLHWATQYEVLDVEAAIRCVQSLPECKDQPIFLMGISRGGACALATAAANSRVAATVTEAAFSTDVMLAYYVDRWAELYVPRWVIHLVPQWHLKITMWLARKLSARRRRCDYVVVERAIQQLQGRKLLCIHGAKDSYVPLEVAQRTFRHADPDQHRLQVFEGADHNQARHVSQQEYDRLIVEFLKPLSRPVPEEPTDSATARSAQSQPSPAEISASRTD